MGFINIYELFNIKSKLMQSKYLNWLVLNDVLHNVNEVNDTGSLIYAGKQIQVLYVYLTKFNPNFCCRVPFPPLPRPLPYKNYLRCFYINKH